ncbi:deazaflavin-dependent nitroreductase family protein [Mycolicibacterium wolinskyi]|uniref:Deazaflavin-dependent nitroreductase family protein n=1 Tax=Mycolicibacterium wolinskyi TaxID=59750 RepID=A0A132PRK4_9MYCO|nr:nitroreductase family deazaflavin-dependent oxidoreductase [Mycolicibacterium wolinskyi]KWX24925.1 deazaflavin-dependent nitroreductase family protein [Mycolicibacterium wolinskyi]
MTEFNSDELLNNRAALDDVNRNVVEEFRSNGGKVGGPFEGVDILLLHNTGAKSGQRRVSPLASFTVDGRLLIVGSYGGAPKDPAWVHNLRANPDVHVEIGTDAYDATAHELSRDERDALYDKVVAAAPAFGEYQAKTDRVIPLFELIRA